MTEENFRKIIIEEVPKIVAVEVRNVLRAELPKALQDQVPTIVSREVSTILQEGVPKVFNLEVSKVLNKELTIFYGQVTRHADKNMRELRAELKADTNRVFNTLDGIAARLTTDEHERAASGHEQKRHKAWIRQLAKTTKTKLVPDIC